MKNFDQTIKTLFKLLPAYQNIGGQALKIGLDNIIKLCDNLGNPELKFKSIHIAGTNGKGSVSHMLASVFQEQGLKVGLYTSPHLLDFRERIKINGEMISKNHVIDFVNNLDNYIYEIKPSFFEVTVAMAFDYFANNNVDIAIIETGLGGRLDSTNIIKPEFSIITNIGLDHTSILGNTIQKIATEKAGIIKKDTPIIIGRKQLETELIFSQIAKQKNADIIYADNVAADFECELKGDYQSENISTVIKAMELQNIFDVNIDTIRLGIKKVVTNTKLRGRWEVISNSPLTICDTGHNSMAWNFIVKQIEKLDVGNVSFVLGFVDDKDVDSILTKLPLDATYYFCQPSVQRALSIEKLKKIVEKYKFKSTFYSNVNEAYLSAKNNSEIKDLIFISGSTFVVADLLSFL